MNTKNRPLDGFEERLLGELKLAVAEHAQAAESAPVAQASAVRPFWRPRTIGIGVAAVAGAGAAVAAPVFLTGPGGASPAFAVEEQEDGTVEVEIMDLRDSGELEEALAEHGIPAVVDYLSDGMACAEPRFEYSPNGNVFISSERDEESREETHRFSVHPEELGPDDTLVLEIREFGEGGWGMGAAVAQGEVADCEPVEPEEGMLPVPDDSDEVVEEDNAVAVEGSDGSAEGGSVEAD